MYKLEEMINQVICGDCIEVMKQMPNKCMDSIICDLPYGTTACSWDTIIPFEPLWEQYKRIIKDNGVIVLTASQPFTSALVMSNLEMFRYEWIWEKQKASNFMSMKYQPAKYHENIVVFSKCKHIYNPIMWETENRDTRKVINNPITNKESHLGKIIRTRSEDTGFRYPKSILKIDKSINNNLHPTQKPVALMSYLIKTYTNENDLVLDNCCGSGSTLVAAKQLGRNFIGIEISEKYCEIARGRLRQEILL